MSRGNTWRSGSSAIATTAIMRYAVCRRKMQGGGSYLVNPRAIEDIMSSICYLVKFQGEEAHAKNLVEKGELFMQSAVTYVELEDQSNKKGQGDVREGIILDCVRKGMDYPMYCMHAVDKRRVYVDQGEEFILFDRRNIEDFTRNNKGYITVLDPMKFIQRFQQKYFGPFDIGLVQYRRRNQEFDTEFIKDGHALFYKDPRFFYKTRNEALVGGSQLLGKRKCAS